MKSEIIINKDGTYQYKDKNGNLSQKFNDCWPLNDGFGVVQKNALGPFQYIDENWNLSEEYDYCWSYCEGFGRVRKYKNGLWQYRDKNGNLSQGFKFCYSYQNGFGKVQDEEGDTYQYRDILGNVTNEETQFGKDIYKLQIGEKTVFDLCDECFLDPKAINVEKLPNGKTRLTGFVAKVLKREYERYISLAGGENSDIDSQITQIKQYFKESIGYCFYKMEQTRSEYYINQKQSQFQVLEQAKEQRKKIEYEEKMRNFALQEDILEI